MLTCLNCGGMSDGSNFCCGACATDYEKGQDHWTPTTYYEETEMRKETKVKIFLDKDDVRTAIEYWLMAEKDVSEDGIENAKFEGLADVTVEIEESEEE